MKKLLYILPLIVLVSSCNEDELDPPSNSDFERVKDEARVETAFEDAEEIAFSGIFDTSDEGGRIEQDGRLACAVLTRTENSENNVVTLVVDFGDGCLGSDDRERMGKIIITHDKKIWEFDASISLEFDGYGVNGIAIEGKRTVINKSTSLQEIKHQVTLENGKIIWPDETFITRESSKIRTWERGEPGFDDDILKIEGTASGVNRLGNSYGMEITEPLIFNKTCRDEGIFVPVSGKKVVTGENVTITVDYGNGDCDNTVTVNAGGSSKDFEVSG